jgi:hypothetical protein
VPHRRLSPAELEAANELLASIRRDLDALSDGDAELRFALNRKLFKELSYDERDKPGVRRRLKEKKRKAQGGLCAQCRNELPERNVVLDRFHAPSGYTEENTQLICEPCDRRIQGERRYA